MKVLQVHNYYQISGGEDTVVAAERRLMEEQGHKVIPFYKYNEAIKTRNFFEKLSLLRETTWSKKSYDEVSAVLKIEQPDICHVHNFLPLISPSVFQACKDFGVPVLQTLHNYRLICTNGLLMRNGSVCEDCLGKSAYGAVMKKCYRDSVAQTYAVARMLERNKTTWNNTVDAYICLTEFARQKFIQHGLPEEKLLVKPNFVDLEMATVAKEPYFVYVGRLTASKGVELLRAAAPQIDWPIKVVGEGELFDELNGTERLELLGKKTHKETLEIIQKSSGLVLPSLWYEGMPMTILEAFATQTPVIASKIGAMESMITHQKNGLLFNPGSLGGLLDNFNFVINQKAKTAVLVENATAHFNANYTPQANYTQLLKIYTQLIQAYA